MCGIAGQIYSNPRYANDKEIKKMLSVIRHRGPDDLGIYIDGRVVLGQRRLSIVDLSSDGKQPMQYSDKYVISFNGEIYNYIEIREELKKEGYLFKTKTDTEVLLAAYDFWKEDCLDHFNGMWSFILYDRILKKVFCARDRYGVKPFYYYATEKCISFASEIKEFTLLDGWKAIGNNPQIANFILNNGAQDYNTETMFKDVFQLCPGQCITYCLEGNDMKIKTWYDLAEHIEETDIGFDEACEKFRDLFEDSVRIRLRSDVKVGSCLSGGLDSSAIVIQMNEILKESQSAEKQQVVCAKTTVKRYDESAYADAVIEKTGVEKFETYPSYSEIIDALENIVWHQDEPFSSTSIIAQWDVYKKARESGLTVMLDGQGADEYLAGYSSYHRVSFRELQKNKKRKELKSSLANYKEKYKDYYYSPYKDMAETTFSKVLPKKAINKAKNCIKRLTGKFVREDIIKAYKNSSYEKVSKNPMTIRDETLKEMKYTSLPKLIHHQDRNSMAHSIESRAPFLDYRLVEFVTSLPSEYKVNNAVTKYIQREALKELLPKIIYERMDKLGFATPEDDWIRENSESFEKLLHDACEILNTIVSSNVTMKEFKREINAKGRLDSIFWCIVCTAAWVKRFDVQL